MLYLVDRKLEFSGNLLGSIVFTELETRSTKSADFPVPL